MTPLHLDRATCAELLATRRLGRLAFNHRAMPDVIPVDYVVDGDDLLIRLDAGTPIITAVRGAVVAFEVDDIDLDQRAGWIITVVGEAHEVLEPTPRQRAAARALRAWAGVERAVLVRITTERMAGRMLGHEPEGRQNIPARPA